MYPANEFEFISIPQYKEAKFKHFFPLPKDKDATLDKQAAEFIDLTLYTIADFLAGYTTEVCQFNGKLELCHLDMTECVREEFPGKLREHALRHGTQDVELYFQGMVTLCFFIASVHLNLLVKWFY